MAIQDIERAERRVAEAKQAWTEAQAERARLYREFGGNFDDLFADEIAAARKALWAAQAALEQAQMSEEEQAELGDELAIHDRLVREFDRSDSDL